MGENSMFSAETLAEFLKPRKKPTKNDILLYKSEKLEQKANRNNKLGKTMMK